MFFYELKIMFNIFKSILFTNWKNKSILLFIFIFHLASVFILSFLTVFISIPIFILSFLFHLIVFDVLG